MSKKKVFKAYLELCDGCRMCELMCSLQKTGKVNPYLARIKVIQSKKDPSHFPIICRHCKNAPCKVVCPVPEAMYLDEETGAVVVDEAHCIQCLACVEACPWGAISVGPNREILKCDLCGGEPVCVKYCPPRPGYVFPHLPWPRQSCLQYVEPYRVPVNKRLIQAEKR